MNVIKKCLKETIGEEETQDCTPLTPAEKPKTNDGWLRPLQMQEKQWYCHNCGKEGHQNSGCDSPITSYGIILFYPLSDRSIIEENIEIHEWFMRKNALQSNSFNPNATVIKGVEEDDNDKIMISHHHEVQYLLILDRHTPDYAQIIIGNYELDSLESIDYLRRLLGRITETEANLILRHNFRDLFLKYWVYAKKDPTKIYHKQFDKANELYTRLLRGISVRRSSKAESGSMKDHKGYRGNHSLENGLTGGEGSETITWKSLISETSPHWFDPDWGFPKGRRRRRSSTLEHEPDLECAMRELAEETGITSDQYRILEEIEPIQEDIKGSNGFNYRNIYFLAEARSLIPAFVNPNNPQQSSEVGKIGWYNYEQACRLIRPYHTARLRILHRIHKYLGSLCPYLNN